MGVWDVEDGWFEEGGWGDGGVEGFSCWGCLLKLYGWFRWDGGRRRCGGRAMIAAVFLSK